MEVENKIPDASGLVTTTVLNTIIGEIKNKIPVVSGVVIASVLNTKIGNIENKTSDHVKYINNPEFYKFAGSLFHIKWK